MFFMPFSKIKLFPAGIKQDERLDYYKILQVMESLKRTELSKIIITGQN